MAAVARGSRRRASPTSASPRTSSSSSASRSASASRISGVSRSQTRCVARERRQLGHRSRPQVSQRIYRLDDDVLVLISKERHKCRRRFGSERALGRAELGEDVGAEAAIARLSARAPTHRLLEDRSLGTTAQRHHGCPAIRIVVLVRARERESSVKQLGRRQPLEAVRIHISHYLCGSLTHQVQLQASYHHCGEAAATDRLTAPTHVRLCDVSGVPTRLRGRGP
jgi:hypothetical protein